MKVLITGANGFLGRSLVDYFERFNTLIYQNKQIYGFDSQLEIIGLSRRELDLLDRKKVDGFFSTNNIDVVLNTAALGGKRLIQDDASVVYENLLIFENLCRNRGKFGFMLNFGSGAELDRDVLHLYENAETDVLTKVPDDYYGLSKNIIAKRIIELNTNIHNFRIFNVFSELETVDRFIKSCVTNYKNEKPIIIHQDRYFDFFFMQDLLQVIYHYINNYNNTLPKTLNIVYNNKYLLSDIANKINKLSNYSVPITIVDPTQGPSYIGSGALLSTLGINFLGLDSGLREMFIRL